MNKIKIIIIACLSLFLTNSIQAQDLSIHEVPANVVKAFESKFKAATKPEWEKEEGMYKVEFRLNQQEHTAIFDQQGNWKETEFEMQFEQLPDLVKQAFNNSKYKTLKIKSVESVASAESPQVYEIEVKDGEEDFELLYDAQGKLILKKY